MSTQPVEVLVTVSFSEFLIEQLREISPRLRITVQGARKAEDVSAEVWRRSEVLYTNNVLPDPEKAPNLKWVQFHYAGVDSLLDAPIFSREDIIFTTLSGAAAPQVAEFALTMLLALGHKLPAILSNQERAEWPKDGWERFSPRELRGSTVGIIGYGSVGRELARLLQPFQVKILATKRDVMHPKDGGYSEQGLGDPDGDLFLRLYPSEAVRSMIKECDFVAVCVPLTGETRGLLGEDELRAMKPTAYLVDVSRGEVIHPRALLSALQENRIAGAALDVFPEEPLPANHPLWRLPNAILSPHVAGYSPKYNERAVALFSENLERYLEGAPLLNRFEIQRGY